MSLLNDALRDLEKRQPQGEPVQPVSPGLAATGKRAAPRRSRWWLAMLCLLILLAGAWLFYRFMSPAGRAGMHSPAVVSIPLPLAKPEPVSVIQAPPTPLVKPSPDLSKPAPARATASPAKLAAKPVSLTEKIIPPAVTKKPRANAKAIPRSTHPLPTKPAATQAQAHASMPHQWRQPVAQADAAKAAQETPSVVSQAPQSPAQKDRNLAGHLARLVQQGQVDRAVQLLKARTLDGHDWPKSRKAMVTALLSIQDYRRAQGLLPPRVTRDYPDLRMLKGRLILATQGAKAALRYLQRDIPDIDAWPDYHATLATLLQQTGQPGKAAQVWSALLQLDNANAAWWAGLGIAMDSSGHAGQARQAYRQALLLPGLNGALDQYVQSRLAKLPQK